MKIKIKYHDKSIKKIEQTKKGDWIDLRVAEDVILFPKVGKKASLGVSIELPEGFEAYIAPRSSLFFKYSVIFPNSISIIDNSYKGNNDIWHAILLNIGTDIVKIPKNTRICQFRVMPVMGSIEFKEVELLNNENRGGIGSTGY